MAIMFDGQKHKHFLKLKKLSKLPRVEFEHKCTHEQSDEPRN